MKTKKILAKILFIIPIAFGTHSCNTLKFEYKKQISEDISESKIANAGHDDDAEFIINAADCLTEQIFLGNLAKKNGSIYGVKYSGEMIVVSAQEFLREVIAIGKIEGALIPENYSKKIIRTYEELSSKSGKEFDEVYCEVIINLLENAIIQFQIASTDCRGTSIRQWAGSVVPTLQTNLAYARSCRQDYKITKPRNENQLSRR